MLEMILIFVACIAIYFIYQLKLKAEQICVAMNSTNQHLEKLASIADYHSGLSIDLDQHVQTIFYEVKEVKILLNNLNNKK